MPPVDLPTLLIAVFSALVTYFWQKRQPVTPSPLAPTPVPVAPHLPDLNNPLMQSLLLLLKQLMERHGPPKNPDQTPSKS